MMLEWALTGLWHGSSDAASWDRAHELLVAVAAHGEISGQEVPCLLIAAKDDLEPDSLSIQRTARVCKKLYLLYLIFSFCYSKVKCV